MEIAKSIRDARARNGWSQQTLANGARVSRATVARLELAEDISTATLFRIARVVEEDSPSTGSGTTVKEYSLADFQRQGVVNWGGKKFTYYSQSVLPGGGLNIPGRHVNAGGYVADSAGHIVLAAPKGVAHGSVFATPFGYPGKVYDTCASCTSSPMWLDVYTK